MGRGWFVVCFMKEIEIGSVSGIVYVLEVKRLREFCSLDCGGLI